MILRAEEKRNMNFSEEVKAEILPISARLIANRAAFKFKCRQIEQIVQKMKEQIPYDSDL